MDCSKSKGDLAEEVVKSVLSDMQKKEKIAGFIQNKKNDRLDSEGIDFLVFLNNDLALPIQVKIYSRSMERYIKRHFKKHPLIKLIIFVQIGKRKEQETIDYIQKEIEEFINKKLSRQ